MTTDAAAIARLAVSACVVIFTAIGMIEHAAISYAAYGRTTTNPWYFMTALPFMFVLLVGGLEAINRHVAAVAAGALAVLFVAIDLRGTWVEMPKAYAATTDTALAWARLSTIHPAMLSGHLRWLFLVVQLGALAVVGGGLIYRPNASKTLPGIPPNRG